MEANYFTVLWWFLPYTDMNQPQMYMCSPSQTRLPPASPSHPSGLSQCASFECPVSCIQLGLDIYFLYGNIHASMLFSQIIPPLSSTDCKSLFFICFSFAVLHTGLSLPSFLNPIYMHLVQFSHSVVSDSMRPHGLQHARPPCQSPTPRVYSNSHPLSQ